MYEVLLGVHNALQTAFRPLRKSVLPVFALQFQFSQLQPILKIQDLSNLISKYAYLHFTDLGSWKYTTILADFRSKTAILTI